MYESSPLRCIRVIYIQPDGGHFGFCQNGDLIEALKKCKPYGIVDLWAKFVFYWKNLNQAVPLLPLHPAAISRYSSPFYVQYS